MKAEKTRLMFDEFLRRKLIAKDGVVMTVLLAEIEELERLATIGKKYEGDGNDR